MGEGDGSEGRVGGRGKDRRGETGRERRRGGGDGRGGGRGDGEKITRQGWLHTGVQAMDLDPIPHGPAVPR